MTIDYREPERKAGGSKTDCPSTCAEGETLGDHRGEILTGGGFVHAQPAGAGGTRTRYTNQSGRCIVARP